MKNLIKEVWKSYKKPTPKQMRKFGDALLASSTFASGYAFFTDHTTLAEIIIVVGVVGKFLTNFYSNEAK